MSQERSRQDRAMEMMVKFKSDSAGRKAGCEDQARDGRFVVAVSVLLEFKCEESVLAWFADPCDCVNCKNLNPRLSRSDLLNSGYSFVHLMREIELEKELILASCFMD